jgi:M6 family metalloprotease-like protein
MKVKTSTRRKSCIPAFIIFVLAATLLLAPAIDAQSRYTLSGILDIIMGDSEKGESSTVYYLYTSLGERIQIYPNSPPPFSYAGAEVTVTGTLTQLADRKVLNATSIVLVNPTPPSAVVSGTRKIALLLFKFSDSAAYTPNDPAYYLNLMNPSTNSVNAFYREESYGLLGIQADVYGWYTLPKPRSYYVYSTGTYTDRIVNDGTAVADPYVNFPQYSDVGFVTNDFLDDNHAWGGTTTITADGQTKTYGVTYEPPWAQTVGAYSHEIGHSLGCPHTGWVYGIYDSIWDVESGGALFNAVLRGSYYSVVKGQTVNLYSENPCHHIAYHKLKLGWLDGCYSEVGAGTATVTLSSLAGARTSPMAVKVRIPGQDPAKRYFLVEARTKINYDQWLPGEGVIIHFVDVDRGKVPSYPIDSTPATGTLNDAQWGTGTTYSNATYGLTIEVLSKTGNSYQVRISLPTGFNFALSNNRGISVTQGGSDSNNVAVTLTSGATQTVTLSASGLPSGATASFAPSSVSPTFTSSCTISASSSIAKGTYTIMVTGSGGGLTRTTSFTLTVTGPQPELNQVQGKILRTPVNTVYFIRTGNQYDDSSLGYVYGKCTERPQYTIIQTDPTRINQATGAPLFTGNVVLFGGYAASKVVNYYEGLGYAPIGFSMNSTHFMFIQGSTVIYSALRSTYDRTKADYFVAQIYMDGPRTIFSLWGIAETGTYASGLYFSAVMHRDLGTYTQGYLICKWTDLNNDGIQTSNEITVVATGT